LATVVRVRQVCRPAEDSCFETRLELFAAFGTKLGVAERPGHESRLILVADRRIVQLRGVERAWLCARGPQCGAESEAVDAGRVEPRLFTQHPCTAELRIVRSLELLAERAVVVAAQRGRQE